MFERFTERARQVVVLAQEEARNQNHPEITVLHILRGLQREEEGEAAKALYALGITSGTLELMLSSLPSTEEELPSQIPFTPDAKQVLELSLREALALGHNYIGTEHILLGLTRCGVFPEYDLGASGEEVRNTVINRLHGRSVAKKPPLYERSGDEIRVVNEETGGEKGSKLARFDLVPWEEMMEVAKLYGKGAEKYAPRNWEKGYDWSLSMAAMQRHLIQFWLGESNDAETECHHLSSVVFHALALMYFEKRHPELDDRPNTVKEDQ